jgi:DMSO/TMAO reductase YedYZ molybdopterin-dependent catalytic subunit
MRNSSQRLAALLIVVGVIAQGPSVLTGAAAVRLSVTGDLPNPLILSREDLAAYPRRTVTLQERNGASATYEGVPLIQILKKAGSPSGEQLRGKALASYVLAIARDTYQVTFTLAELDPEIGNDSVIVADKRDGKPLPDREGPLRLIASLDKKPARSVRMQVNCML